MIYCKDCSFFRPPTTDPSGIAKCNHPSAICDLDCVWGYDVFYSAKAMRESTKACGLEAKWFKPLAE